MTFGSPLPVRSSPRTASDIVEVDSVIGNFLAVGRSSPRLAIASGVEGAQREEAASKIDKTSAMCGRTLGSLSQHFSASAQTSSERPRISRFGGREGRSPDKTSKGTT